MASSGLNIIEIFEISDVVGEWPKVTLSETNLG